VLSYHIIIKEQDFVKPVMEREEKMWRSVQFVRDREELCKWCKWVRECISK